MGWAHANLPRPEVHGKDPHFCGPVVWWHGPALFSGSDRLGPGTIAPLCARHNDERIGSVTGPVHPTRTPNQTKPRPPRSLFLRRPVVPRWQCRHEPRASARAHRAS